MRLNQMVSVLVVCVCLSFAPSDAKAQSCTACGPGLHWIDGCSSGVDVVLDQWAVIGLDLDLDCVAETSLVLQSCGDLTITRSSPSDDSSQFPGTRPVDGHLETVDTEIISLCLSGGSATLIAGAGLGQGGVLAPSLGAIAENLGDPTKADSFFHVMFEFDLGGGNFVYNQTPLIVSSDITCVPPQTTYEASAGCLPLFDSPVGGTLVANLISLGHNVNLAQVPAVSSWGMMALILIVMVAGTVVFHRVRITV